LLLSGVPDIELGRQVLSWHGEDSGTHRYVVSVRGEELTGLQITTPWGESFDALDFLPADWAGEYYSSNDDPNAEKYLDFVAKTDANNLRWFEASWYTDFDLDIGTTTVKVTDADGEVTASDLDFSATTIPQSGPDVYYPVPQYRESTITTDRPVFSWASWADAPADGQLWLDIRESRTAEDWPDPVRQILALDATTWTPTSDLQGAYDWTVSFVDQADIAGEGWTGHVWSAKTEDGKLETSKQTEVIGNHAGAHKKGWSFVDTDGDIVTPILTSKAGWAELTFLDGELHEIILHNTTASDNFAMRVKAPKDMAGYEGNWLVKISGFEAVGTASLNTLDLGATDWDPDDEVPIACQGTVRNLRLGYMGGYSFINIQGSATSKLSFTAVDVENANLKFGGTIDKLSVQSWQGGKIKALGIGSLTSTIGAYSSYEADEDRDFAADLDVGIGGIGSITEVGSNFAGDITTTGAIGSITVTGVSVLNDGDPDNGEGGIAGGGLFSDITVGSVKGKSIGNITLTGGGLGVGGGQDEDCDRSVIRAAGDIGNILIRPLKYVGSIEQEGVFDKYGTPKFDRNGEMIFRYTKVMYQRGGGISTDLETPGKLGNLTAVGGNIEGRISATKGMGNIVAQSITRSADGAFLHTYIVEDVDDVLVCNLDAELLAAVGPKGVAIASVSVMGGDWNGRVSVSGSIGKISMMAFAAIEPGYLLEQDDLVGGSIECGIVADSIGAISMTGGSLDGSMIAMSGGIGKIDVAFGAMNTYLTAYSSIGAITLKGLAINAMAWVDRWTEDGETNYEPQSTEGYVIAGALNVSISLGYRCDTEGNYLTDASDETIINTKATLGAITGIGTDVSVTGYVPWDPSKSCVTSAELKYISGYDWDDDRERFYKWDDGVAGGPDCCEVDLHAAHV